MTLSAAALEKARAAAATAPAPSPELLSRLRAILAGCTLPIRTQSLPHQLAEQGGVDAAA